MKASPIVPLPLVSTSQGKFVSPRQLLADLQCKFLELQTTLDVVRKRVEAMRNVCDRMTSVALDFEFELGIHGVAERCLDSHSLHTAAALLVATTGANENLNQLESLIRDGRVACLELRRQIPLSY